MTETETLTPAVAAQQAGVHVGTIHLWCRMFDIGHFTRSGEGRGWHIYPEGLQAIIDARREGGRLPHHWKYPSPQPTPDRLR